MDRGRYGWNADGFEKERWTAGIDRVAWKKAGELCAWIRVHASKRRHTTLS